MRTKNDSMGPPASSGSALISASLEHSGEAVVAVDEGQKIVAFGSRAAR